MKGLSKKEAGEMAMTILGERLMRDGSLQLDPKKIKKEIKAGAKALGCSRSKFAKFGKLLYASAMERSMGVIDKAIKK